MKQAHEQAPEASPVWAPVILEGFWFRGYFGVEGLGFGEFEAVTVGTPITSLIAVSFPSDP